MTKLEESMRDILAHLASEVLKARKIGDVDRAEKLIFAFRVLSEELEKVRRGKGDRRSLCSFYY